MVMKTIDFRSNTLPAGFYWFNPPASYRLDDGLTMVTRAETDFWQRTHYGFRRDDGHCLLTRVSGDFSIETETRCRYEAQYDQCGLMIRSDSNHWIKCSVEYEDDSLSRLGSVVTNGGYSDWATQDLPSLPDTMRYRINKRGADFLVEYAAPGDPWRQMRIAHLNYGSESLEIGLYACSPIGKSFQCRFSYLSIGPADWQPTS